MNIYYLSMKKTTFFKESSHIVATSIKIEDNLIYFKTDVITKKYLDDNKISYNIVTDIKKNYLKHIFLNMNLILFFIIFILILYINSYRVNKVSFNGEYEINDRIEESLNKKYIHFLFFNFIDVDFESLSKTLRNEFSEYEWIEVYKDGTTINVVINNKLNFNEYTNEVSGDIIAKKDGIIKSFRVYEGKSIVSINQYVKKGDILISGNVEENFLSAKGIVLANTYEEINIRIEKEEIITKETGKSNKYKLFSLFNKLFSFKKRTKFESYQAKKTLKFNFFNFFQIYQIEEIELYDIIKTNTYENALEKAQNEILESFLENRTSSEEEIEKLVLLIHEEDEEAFHFRFLAKKLESIGVFNENRE